MILRATLTIGEIVYFYDVGGADSTDEVVSPQNYSHQTSCLEPFPFSLHLATLYLMGKNPWVFASAV
ncbi:hypothetical protein C4544_06920 [candidate division WS5 bacterium]|uniref:Uncharacterized protein n=1 Tax=candidate division WS5 bacterium TaxID=2093353 RepID=A0A419DAC2_9BACT|nr:MAG: hypothetical protein C4544_06920 [candidate division WS5 bacterium]